MKKLILIILSVLIFICCSMKENDTKEVIPANPDYTENVAAAASDYLYHQNDLVYHDYGTGVKLTKNSTLCLPQLDLKLQDKRADIYVINLEMNEIFKLCSYEPLQEVSYSPLSDGVYQIIAAVSNGEVIDLTPKASIRISYTMENGNGLILLK